MNPNHRSIFNHALGILLCLAGIQPLVAQLDPRLQSSKTDFLDLYQQSVNVVMKPEVVSVFDFSGSMRCVMFHKDFINMDTDDGGTTENDAYLGLRLMRRSSTGPYDVDCVLDLTGTSVVGDGGAFTKLENGKLVRPDGTLVTEANIDANYTTTSGLGGETATKKSSNIQNWVRSASHVRFTYNSKTFDIPINWTVLFDPADPVVQTDTTNPNVSARKYLKMYNTYPLKATLLDPAASNQEVEIDRTYRITNAILSSPSTTQPLKWFGSSTDRVDFPALPSGWSLVHYTYIKDVAHRPYYYKWIWETSAIPQATVPEGRAFRNGIPARTRVQAVKDAAFRTWSKYHNKVFWAYRFLKFRNPADSDNQREDALYPSNDSRNDFTTRDPLTQATSGQTQRGWQLLTNNSQVALNRLAAYRASGSTTLNSAMANTLAQLNDPNNVFNDVETGNDKPVECRNTYVMLFTDGVPNTDPGDPTNTNTHYVGFEPAPAAATYGTAKTGNAYFAADKTRIDPGNAAVQYNIINLAALAAHGGETTDDEKGGGGGWDPPIYPATTQTFPTPGSTWKTSDWLPFWIRQRGAGSERVTFKKPRPITTMTVGVSLAGTINDTDAGKRRLFLAAAVGNPSVKSWDTSTLTEFTLLDPSDPTQGKTENSTYFFDATNPDKLTQGLDAAFYELSLTSNVNVTANPNLPLVGASIANQIYLGKFRPPTSGGAVWPGDLLMFGTREVNGQVVIVDKSGNPTTTLDETNAQWSAQNALLKGPLWKNRKLYTRLPGATTLKPFTDVGTEFTDSATGLQKYVATSMTNLVNKQRVIQFAAGGDLSKPGPDGRPTANRADIMGDVINSAATAIEFNWKEVEGQVSAYPRLAAVVGGNRFRLILVGTNQGWLHAFGEVTRKSTVNDANNIPRDIITGDVEELWSFMPTDFLANLNYMTIANNPHRFMVDGTPAIYHLDAPPSTGGPGNRVVDVSERAIAIIGLRKGGRSYYALDIHNPFSPALKWSMVPDEAASLPAERVAQGGPDLATTKELLSKWGFSSCTPAFGRIKYNGFIKDAVFFGGGYSVPEIEAGFGGAKLGRSVMALDTYTGEVLAAADLTAPTLGGATVGPVGAGIVPFQFVINSGMAQRAYFLDYKGGLWAWGSKAVSSAAPYVDFRIDSSQITDWSIRKVYQDDDPVAKGARYTTLPAPFRAAPFPGAGKPGSASPAAVGIAMVSGDRNNPLDREYSVTTNPAPVNHRLTLVFDRQDSRAWGFDTAAGPDSGIKNINLKNFTGNTVSSTPADACADAILGDITPGCPNYYLAPYSGLPPTPGTPAFGYYVNFPSASGGFIPKGINRPFVLAGSLFYAYFTPESEDPCTGGSGTTRSYLITNVLNPIVTDNRSGRIAVSGLKETWVGVASDFFALGTKAVLQAGVRAVADPKKGESATAMAIATIAGTPSQRFPKPRVWRTVH